MAEESTDQYFIKPERSQNLRAELFKGTVERQGAPADYY